MVSKLLMLSLVATLVAVAQSGNILLLMGTPSRSHQIWFTVLLKELTANGKHNVTILTSDVDPKPMPNTHYIDLEGVYEHIYNEQQLDLTDQDNGVVAGIKLYYDYGLMSCRASIASNGFKHLLNYPADFKFDLVLHEYTVGPCLLGFMHRFHSPPMIAVSPYPNPPGTVDVVGGHNHFAYIPFSIFPQDSDMTFVRRLQNLFIYAYDYYYRLWVFLPAIDQMVAPAFGRDCPPVSELQPKTAVALINVHPAINFAESFPPNVISIGGLQIKEPKPLDAETERFFQAAPKGVVLVSLGTNVRSSDLGVEKQKIFLQAFAAIADYHFVWKFETDDLPMALPKNVMVKKWLSQCDILGHNRTKAFVTHSGGLGTQEAYWFGVPMLPMPFIVDQFRNSYKSVRAGVAEQLNFNTLTLDTMVSTIRKVLDNPKYMEKAKLISRNFRDQPERPVDRAVWWIEYVMRNPNPDHLRSPVLKMGLVAGNSYDTLLLIFVTVTVLLWAFWKLVNAGFNSKAGDKIKLKQK